MIEFKRSGNRLYMRVGPTRYSRVKPNPGTNTTVESRLWGYVYGGSGKSITLAEEGEGIGLTADCRPALTSNGVHYIGGPAAR